MHHVARLRYTMLWLAAALAGAIGCGSSASAPHTSGSLRIEITAAVGTTPSVVISGPNNYSKTISTSQTLSGLDTGVYTIVGDSVTAPDSIIGTFTDTGYVLGTPDTVRGGVVPNTVTVVYALKSRTGALWVANNFYATIPALASNQLRMTAPAAPAETLATALSGPSGLALDASGNMWVSSWSSDSLDMYTPAARNSGGALPPTTVIVSAALNNANGIAFDAHGDLWVANCGGGNLLEYSAAQLAAGGSQAPNATLSSGTTLLCPYFLAFDANGNVWVADDSLDHVVEYSAAQLAAGGSTTPVPVETIGSNNGSLNHTTAVAFDAAGNLWVANDSSPTVVAYAPALLAAGGAPAPTVIITLPDSTDPYGLVFDQRGTLWVSDGRSSTMYGLAASQLLATGAPAPSVVIGVGMTNFFEPQQAVFDPYAMPALISSARFRSSTPSLARVRGGLRHRRHRAR